MPHVLRYLAAAAAILAASAAPARAEGDLLVTPTRVVFEGGARSAAIAVVNKGDKPATYRVSFVHRRMTATGDFVDVPNPGPDDRVADGLVRWAPKQILLRPGESQAVRLLLTEAGAAAAAQGPAEFRSHLLFRAVPDDLGAPTGAGGGSGLQVVIRTVYGVSVPVIVRTGQPTATVAISDLAVAAGGLRKPTALAFALKRSGERSVFGDLTAAWHPARGGAPVILGRARGVAVYTTTDVRRVKMSLEPPAGGLGPGKVVVTYAEPAATAGALAATAELPVP